VNTPPRPDQSVGAQGSAARQWKDYSNKANSEIWGFFPVCLPFSYGDSLCKIQLGVDGRTVSLCLNKGTSDTSQELEASDDTGEMTFNPLELEEAACDEVTVPSNYEVSSATMRRTYGGLYLSCLRTPSVSTFETPNTKRPPRSQVGGSLGVMAFRFAGHVGVAVQPCVLVVHSLSLCMLS